MIKIISKKEYDRLKRVETEYESNREWANFYKDKYYEVVDESFKKDILIARYREIFEKNHIKKEMFMPQNIVNEVSYEKSR